MNISFVVHLIDGGIFVPHFATSKRSWKMVFCLVQKIRISFTKFLEAGVCKIKKNRMQLTNCYQLNHGLMVGAVACRASGPGFNPSTFQNVYSLLG